MPYPSKQDPQYANQTRSSGPAAGPNLPKTDIAALCVQVI
jgi:hypothetical protein